MSAQVSGPRKPAAPSVTAAVRDAPADERAAEALTPLDDVVEASAEVLMAHDPRSTRAETVRALRTELLLRRDSPRERSDAIALLSPSAGEGRSLLAADLAVAYAQTGQPTLLVDADMRRPRQHVLFPIQNRKGLSQAIEFGMAPHLYGVRNVPRLSVLTAGAVQRNPLELLSSQRFAAMVEDWRGTYAHVVIDTAPVGEFSDGLAVASVVGRVLTLSRAQRTPFRDMQEMLRRLAATRAQILGAVINHF